MLPAVGGILSGVASPTWEEAVLALSPMLFLRFDGNLNDLAGLGYGANIAGVDITYEAGGIGGTQRARFNGTSSTINLGAAFIAAFNSLGLGNEGSIVLWSSDDNWASSAGRHMTFMIQNSGNYIDIFHELSSQLRIDRMASGSLKFARLPNHNPPTSQMYTLTWDSAGTLSLYHNKILVSQQSGLASFAGSITQARIGSTHTPSGFWDGTMDEYTVFDYDLTAENVEAIFDAANVVNIGALNRIDEDLDFDFIAVGDIAGNGRNDVVSGNSTGGSGAAVFWYEQPADPADAWTKRTIDASGGTKLEGATIGDFDGDGELEVVVLDQGGNAIRLYKPTTPGDPTGTWSETTLTTTNYSTFQDALAIDIDGDGRPEIVFTAEAGANAGVAWLDWNSGDVTNAANWSVYQMVAHLDAYWLARERKDWGSGANVDIAVCARADAFAVEGVYTLQKPADPTDPWTRSTVTNEVRDWIKVQNGDFSGDGTGKDLIACDNASTVVKWWRYSDSWAETSITAPAGAGNCWNLRVIGSYGGRSMFIVAYANYDIVLYRWEGAAYVGYPIGYSTQAHPLDDDIALVPLLGNGRNQLIIPDSSTSDNKLIWIDVEASNG